MRVGGRVFGTRETTLFIPHQGPLNSQSSFPSAADKAQSFPTEEPKDAVKGGIAISGVYDLEPLLYSYLQPVLRLDHPVPPCAGLPDRGNAWVRTS